MIKEEYVSFEVARLLNDKGFNEPTIGTYNIESKNPILVERPIRAIHCEAIISAPTQAMAMMWLREVHNLHVDSSIYIDTDGDIEHEYTYTYWDWLIFNSESGRRIAEPQIGCGRYDSYEQACEAAIKYCLENLI